MKQFYTLLLACLISGTLSAQPSTGEIMFVGYNADGDVGFSFVTLVSIPANTTIYFTDNEWNGSAIGAGGAFNDQLEGAITWESGISTIDAGTVVTFTSTSSAGTIAVDQGSIADGTINLSGLSGGDVLYAFLGTDNATPTTFLTAITNSDFDASGTITNTGLTAGTNAVSISGDVDVMVYSGSTSCDSDMNDCMTELATAANWSTEDGLGDQSNDGFSPDFPTNVPSSFGGSALPIELLHFSATILPGPQVQINWQTATEVNNAYFEVLRWAEGYDWETIATIEGAGFSNAPLEYTEIDPEPIQGVSYYRLRQVDYDGRSELFELYAVECERKVSTVLSAYPNPFAETLTLNGDNLQPGNVLMTNAMGQRVLPAITWQGGSQLVVHTSDLPPGTYLVHSGTDTHRVVKY